MHINKYYPSILIVTSVVGLIASLLLLLNTIKFLENPKVDLPCNINPFISCTNAISSKQGQVFGFPNPILGIISFSMLLSSGAMLLTHSEANRKYWTLVNLGLFASMLFVLWFMYQSFYILGTLCLYCMVVWSVTWPSFLYTTIWNYKRGGLRPNTLLDFISKNHLPVLLSFYFLGILLALIKFRDFLIY